MSKLALLGGRPVRATPFPASNTIGAAEKAAALRVLDSGVLSGFVGAWGEAFFGGPEVRRFESRWAATIGVRHAIAVNSATSGLYAAVGAARVGPGDEVIVSPFTMSASALAPVVFNAVPVFADIDPRTYCLSAAGIEARITPRTKAIIVVQLFGQAAEMPAIMALARRHRLTVIEDAAQAPLAEQHGRKVGALGDIGVFSLNYHKHIHTGEGGVIVTDDDDLAERLQLIRNHGEAVAQAKGVRDLVDLIGFNFRLGEIEAAIGTEQLARAPDLIAQRRANVAALERRLAALPGLAMPYVPPGSRHVYYVHAIDYDAAALGAPRDLFVRALKAELPATALRERDGPLIAAGYVAPLYLQPMFQQRLAYGALGCPFACPHYDGTPDYAPGLCPAAETAHARLIRHELMRPPMTPADLDAVADAFEKIVEHRVDLLSLAA